jgi:hypothetical protein
MAKKLGSSKKVKKPVSTGNPREAPTGQILASGASSASTVLQGTYAYFFFLPVGLLTPPSIQALSKADRFVPTAVLVGNELN